MVRAAPSPSAAPAPLGGGGGAANVSSARRRRRRLAQGGVEETEGRRARVRTRTGSRGCVRAASPRRSREVRAEPARPARSAMRQRLSESSPDASSSPSGATTVTLRFGARRRRRCRLGAIGPSPSTHGPRRNRNIAFEAETSTRWRRAASCRAKRRASARSRQLGIPEIRQLAAARRSRINFARAVSRDDTVHLLGGLA